MICFALLTEFGHLFLCILASWAKTLKREEAWGKWLHQPGMAAGRAGDEAFGTLGLGAEGSWQPWVLGGDFSFRFMF